MRKKDETLRETLLEHARRTAKTDGLSAINIRGIAKQAGVATGTVYNYFKSKDDILMALTEEYWRATLLEMRSKITDALFYEQLEEIYMFLKERIETSAGALMNSLHNVKSIGRERMAAMQQSLKISLIQQMQHDTTISTVVWNDSFTRDEYAAFIIGNMMFALQSGQKDIHFLIEIIKRTIY